MSDPAHKVVVNPEAVQVVQSDSPGLEMTTSVNRVCVRRDQKIRNWQWFFKNQRPKMA